MNMETTFTRAWNEMINSGVALEIYGLRWGDTFDVSYFLGNVQIG